MLIQSVRGRGQSAIFLCLLSVVCLTAMSAVAEDFSTRGRGFNPPPGYQEELERNLKIFPVDKALPSSINWKTAGGVTPVKDQGSCGSCWAYASAAELEAMIKIYYGQTLNLSEQQMVSCNPYGAGCDGGWATASYALFLGDGAVLEDAMPYAAADPPLAPCVEDDYLKFGFITGYNYISNDVDQIKAALQYGPVCTGIDASPAFEDYTSGCYDDPGYGTNHLVLIVGYDDKLCGGVGGWIIKNSWGAGFGEAGYVNVAYGAGNTGTSVTQLQYAAPPVTVAVTAPSPSVELFGDVPTLLEWTTSGGAVSTVDIWLGTEGRNHTTLVASGVPNTGSYEMMVPNFGTDYGSLVVVPNGDTREGFGFSQNYLKILGHAVRYVSPLGSNEAPFLTPATAAHTINAAVSACTGTDTVMVAGGDYVTTVTVNSMVRLMGGYSEDFSVRDLDLYPTRLQSGSTAVRFMQESRDFGLLDGFEIHDCTGGNYANPAPGRHGGGVYIAGASPLIKNCRFIANRADVGVGTGFGGAICAVGGDVTVESTEFTGNLASQGGAVALFDGARARFTDCLFDANQCADGLSGFVGGTFYAEACTLEVTGGHVRDSRMASNGGACYLVDAVAIFNDLEMSGHQAAQDGGAILALGSDLTLSSVLLADNEAGSGSGGGFNTNNTVLTVRNVRLSGNQSGNLGGGGLAMGASGVVENCLIDGNSAVSAGGMMVLSAGDFQLRNSVVTGNSGGGLTAIGAAMTADFNAVTGNTGGDYVSMAAGPHDVADPLLFVDAAAGDYGLAVHSPCLDRGADDPACLDPDGSRADIGLLGGPGAQMVAPGFTTGAVLSDLGGGTVRLTWDPSAAADIDHYVVYRDTAAVFTPTPSKALTQVGHPTVSVDDTPPGACYYYVVAVDDAGHAGGYSEQVLYDAGIVTPAGDDDLPKALAFAGVVPNPFNPMAQVRYDIPRPGHASLVIYDVRGRAVRNLVSEWQDAGRHAVVWDGRTSDGRTAAAGVYFARLDHLSGTVTTKMVLAK